MTWFHHLYLESENPKKVGLQRLRLTFKTDEDTPSFSRPILVDHKPVFERVHQWLRREWGQYQWTLKVWSSKVQLKYQMNVSSILRDSPFQRIYPTLDPLFLFSLWSFLFFHNVLQTHIMLEYENPSFWLKKG